MPRARRALESLALAAVLVLPWFFTVYTDRVFEAEKMAALRALGGPALVVILALLWRRPAQGASQTEPGTIRGSTVARRFAALRPPARRLAIAAAAFWLTDALTTAVSRAPLVSLFGSYDRGFGLLSTTALIVLGVGAASLTARPGGAERLARALGASTLPTALYGIFQRVGADPLPWLGDVVTRVSGAAGASVMLGAHLAMALPFAVWATWCAYGAAVEPVERRATGASTELPRPAIEPGASLPGIATTSTRSGGLVAQLRLAAWLVIDVAAITALLLSGSRGPVLAAVAAGGVTALAVAARAGRGRLAGALVGAAAVALLGILALNRHPAAFGPIARLPVIDRLAVALDPERSTTRVRLRLWEGTTAAIGDLGARQLVGTGPETMPLVWAAHYPSVLAYDEPRGWVPDRAHNLWLDRWLTTGVLGAASLLALLLTALLAALNGLGLVERRRDAATALAAVLGAGGGAAAAARLLDGGWRLAAPSFGLGLVGGLALWLALAARRRTHPVDGASAGAHSPAALHLAALGMLTAFVVETDVGFVVTATGVVLWLTLGALIGAGVARGEEQRDAFVDQNVPLQSDGMWAAALIAVTGLHDFGRAGLVGPGAIGAVALVGLAALIVGLALGERWRARESLVAAAVVGAAAVAHFGALRLGSDGPSDAVWGAAGTLAVLAVSVGGLIAMRARAIALPETLLAALFATFLAALALTPTIADAAYKEGRIAWEDRVAQWREQGEFSRARALLDGADERYRGAARLAPWEARYRLARGMAADVRGDLWTAEVVAELARLGRSDARDEYAASLADGAIAALAARRDAAFEAALGHFDAALALAPGDAVAAVAKARAWRLWGDLTREPERRRDRLASAREAYVAVRGLAPNWPELLAESAQVELLDGRPAVARPLAESALAMDRFYYQGWKTIAAARLADGDAPGAADAWSHYFDDPRNAGDVAALRARVAAQLQADDVSGGLKTARGVVRLVPEDARAWADLALLLARTGARAEARDAAARAAALNPNDAGIRALLKDLANDLSAP